MKEIVITEREAGQRLDKYLQKCMPQAPKSFFYKMLRKKNITWNGKRAEGKEKLKSGDTIRFFLAQETIEKFSGEQKEQVSALLPEKYKPQIVYEDDQAVIFNKPAGLLSQKARPAGGVSHRSSAGKRQYHPGGAEGLSPRRLQPSGQEYQRPGAGGQDGGWPAAAVRDAEKQDHGEVLPDSGVRGD